MRHLVSTCDVCDRPLPSVVLTNGNAVVCCARCERENDAMVGNYPAKQPSTMERYDG